MFSDSEKSEAEELLGEAFGGYKEEITIYRTPTVAYVSSGPNFNFAFGEAQPAVDSTYTPQSGVFWATVEYLDQQDNQYFLRLNPESNVVMPRGEVRISVTGALAKSYLEDCEKIVLDGRPFKPITDLMPRGLFARGGYDCWLRKIDNGQV